MNLPSWLASMFLMGCVLYAATAGAAEIVIDESSIIDSRLEEAGLRIVDGANPPTIVEFIDPAYVEQSVIVEDASILHLLGGEIHDSLILVDEGIALVSGGTVGDTVRPQGASTLVVAGGALLDYIYAADTSTVAISAGTLWGVNATDNATVTITGGEFRAWPQEYGLFVDGAATIVIEGTNFNFPAGAIADSAGTLIGNLADGTPITADFQVHGNGAIVLVPEPASVLLLSCGAGLLWLYFLNLR